MVIVGAKVVKYTKQDHKQNDKVEQLEPQATKNNHEISWLNYFESIQQVCPWSLESYKAGRLLILPYNPRTIAENDITWNDDICDAVVYVGAPDDVDRLDAEVEDLNSIEETDCIYFWSHPEHTKGGGFQTPIPVIIQQSKNNLEQIRKQYK